MNEEFVEQLKNMEFISNVQIDKTDGKIYIIPKNVKKLQDKLPDLLSKNKIRLNSFYQPELSLQDIFMEIMSKNKVNHK